MTNFISLKYAAGTLGPQDISNFSSWLNSPIDLNAAKQADHTQPKEERQSAQKSTS